MNNKALNIVGILLLIGVVWLVIKAIKEKTETKLYDEKALDKLKNKETRQKIEKAIDDYHKTGKWNDEILADL